jgi:hypothetical protein
MVWKGVELCGMVWNGVEWCEKKRGSKKWVEKDTTATTPRVRIMQSTVTVKLCFSKLKEPGQVEQTRW